jgi:TrpR-related protein YerC/YecD
MPVYDPTIWDEDAAKELLDAILRLDNKSMAQAFLADVLTNNEIQEFGNRLRTARMLKNGESYDQIQAATGMSTTTIARVSEWLKKGAGGYDLVLRSINNNNHSHITPS